LFVFFFSKKRNSLWNTLWLFSNASTSYSLFGITTMTSMTMSMMFYYRSFRSACVLTLIIDIALILISKSIITTEILRLLYLWIETTRCTCGKTTYACRITTCSCRITTCTIWNTVSTTKWCTII